MRCVVIGAGINGLSTAIWLQRFGHDVMLVDRAEPGSGTSYGNAGILAAGAVLPVTVPGLITKIAKMVLSKHSPPVFAVAVSTAVVAVFDEISVLWYKKTRKSFCARNELSAGRQL